MRSKANDLGGEGLPEANPLFERLVRDAAFYSGDLMTEIARTGTVRQIPSVPADVRASFVTGLEIAPPGTLKHAGRRPATRRCRGRQDHQPAGTSAA